MPPYFLFLAAALHAIYALGSLRPRDESEGQRKTILHDDPSIQYSEIAANQVPPDHCDPVHCLNTWWIEKNDIGLPDFRDSAVRLTHNTSPKGSKFIELIGKKDGKPLDGVRPRFEPNGNIPAPTGGNQGVIFSQKGLDPEIQYTMDVSYNGNDLFRIVAIEIDGEGHFLPANSSPSPPATSPPGAASPIPPTSSNTTPATDPTLPNSPNSVSHSTSAHSSGQSDVSPPASSSSKIEKSPISDTHRPSASSAISNVLGPGGQQYASETSRTGMGKPTTVPGGQVMHRRRGKGGLIAGIVIGVLIFLLILALTLIYLRRRLRARRAPSYAFRTRKFIEDAHWTERPISPIVPSSAEWESFDLPPEKDGKVEVEKSNVQTPLFERRATLGSESGLGLAL